MSAFPVIALIEPFWVGHPETQLRLFIESLLRENHQRVLVLCRHPEAILSWIRNRHPETAHRCFAAPFAFCEKRGEFPSTSLASWSLAHESLLAAERAFGFTVGKVFITWLDPFICPDPDSTAALMPRPWVGLYLFPSYLRQSTPLSRFFPSQRQVMDRSFFKTSYCFGVAVLDEGVRRPLASIVSRSPVHVLPDVADVTTPSAPPPLTQLLMNKAAGRPIVGLLGVLGKRKGTLSFLQAMDQVDPAQCFFLLAGRLGSVERGTYGSDLPELDSRLTRARARDNALIHLDPIDTEATFNSLISACSVLYLSYENHFHSSGILTKAAHFQKLVVAPNRGCMGERVREFRLGTTIRPGSASRAAAAITTLCRQGSRTRHLARARFSSYQATHNRDTLKVALDNLLKELP